MVEVTVPDRSIVNFKNMKEVTFVKTESYLCGI
jgi:hypothetical protein